MIKRVLVLGATGRTGRYVVEYALERGLQVVALVRQPQRIAPQPNLSIVRGTAEKTDDVETAIAGCDAVLSTLNNNRISDLPWARPVSPPLLMTRSVANVTAAMRLSGARRIVVLSALGAGDSFAQAPFVTRFLMRYTNLRIVFEDHTGQEEVVQTSGLDWTCVRAAILTNARSLKKPMVTFNHTPKPALTIGRRNVARFMIEILDKPAFFRKAPIVSSA